MSATTAAEDVVAIMHRRTGILACLLEEPREKRALVDELDVARSTLDRAIRELESVDLVAYDDGTYGLTAVGERLAYDFFGFVDRVQLAMRFRPFLEHTTLEEFDLDLRCLVDAELLTPEPNDPYAMVNRHVERLRQADEFRGMLPLVGLHAFEVAHEQVTEHGCHHEVVVEAGVVETCRSNGEYRGMLRELCEHDRCRISVHDGPIPYYVGVFDDETVQIGVDEDGEPRALAETNERAVRAWAQDRIDEYQQRTTPIAAVVS